MFLSCTCAFHSESTLNSCLNVKELFVQKRRDIWSLSDCNGTRTHNHVVHKRKLKHLVFFHLSSWYGEAENEQLFQLQYHSCIIGFTQSWKQCLNLWSRRWLKPSHNLVINFTPFGLRQLKKEFALGRMNFRILLLKILRLSELQYWNQAYSILL